MVAVGDGVYHLIAGPNADQYAGEMRGQLAASAGAGLSAADEIDDGQRSPDA